MFFPTPHPTYWIDPGPLPVDRWRRAVWAKFWPLYELKEHYIGQWKRYSDRLADDAEKQQAFLQQQADFEAMQAQYHEQGEYWADRLPIWLHHMGLSYKRPVRERKDEQIHIRVHYCELETWFFDEYAFYFWLQTWPLPYGLKISDFEPNAGDSTVAMTLAAAFGTDIKIEFNDRYHTRPGLWIVAEHRAGRGQVPKHVAYQKLFNYMPKGAKALAWPIGQAVNSKILLGDLGELYHLGVGGQTGGGKSNQINVLLCSFLARNTPAELRLFLVDFKRVELAFYKGLPHLGGDVPWLNKPLFLDDDTEEEEPILLRTVAADYEAKNDEKLNKPLGGNVITNGSALLKLLDYILSEIFRRMAIMEGKVKKISQWNKRNPRRKFSEWVLVVDELGDIMLQPGINKKVERKLVRILQLGRAAGIHAILATQTPKSEVITSLIQNNLTAWVVTRTGNGAASGLMLDGKHTASKLPAIPGRIIFRQAGELAEVQTPEITDLTIRKVVKEAKAGKAPAARQETTIPPETIFTYALQELSGFCGEKDLHERFKKEGVSRKEIRQILRDYTVAGSPPALEPEIEINEEYYYLTPYIKGSNNPRQLMKVDDFISEFEETWAAHVAQPEPETVRRAPHAPKNTETTGGNTPENSKPEQTEEAGKHEKELIKLVSGEPVIKLPKRTVKREKEAAAGDFPLAVVLDARQRKQWQHVKDKLGANDDNQAMGIILENIEEGS